MISSLARSARLLRQVTAPAACFGTGYALCWTQGREETVPQLLVCAAAASWAGLTQGLRLLGQSLPEGAEWPRKKLQQVESAELRSLVDVVARAAEQGLDSAPLRRLALRRLCQRAEADPRGLAVLGLVPSDEQGKPSAGALTSLAARVDEAATALAASGAKGVQSAGEPELLLSLTAAMRAIIASGGASWHEDLGTPGVLHLAHAALLASSWLAAAVRPAAAASAAASVSPTQGPGAQAVAAARLTEEDEQAVVQGLIAVWQALGQPHAAAQLRSVPRSRRTPEVLELHRDLEARFAALEAPVLPTSALQLGSRPMQDFLPNKLRARVAAVMRGAVPTSAPSSAATAVGVASDAAGEGGMLRKAGKVLEYSAWAVLVGALVVASSEDGFGYFRFHAVPGRWRESLRSVMQQQAVQVEELFAKYDPTPESGNLSDSITLGPWGAQSTYIQAPQPQVPHFTAPS